ncbi:YbfB/YjiJ family MFS transporter [Reyranella sp. CPCC 100927]|uniref:YbfB/YjiJ family MFS transporter n=1 Tax=Reyranella sp. CPCC 100927 TaxID=2599616 RepID=UPI0011B5BC07|nr:YbfB/YjiJ family MFS transporter [Reyranella sp. CPCC 100927]TWT02695.1 YbfB/YjiJ family MFS transporter [Reyranella sp. CPCC 100927]
MSGESRISHRLALAGAVSAGLSASFVGIGLSRFAYTPLVPALIDAGWFTPAAAAYLGAANLAGYLAGALAARHLAARVSAPTVLRAMLVLATLSFFACATPLSFPWFFAWRFASGLAGGALMVLAASAVLPHVPPQRRGVASGIIFAGVGLGIAASGTLVPLLLRWGVIETWCVLGTVALAFTVIAWRGWPNAPAATSAPPIRRRGRRTPAALKALYVEYALNAVGLVPHMVFLVDFVARGLGQGVDAGAQYWVLFGLGATAGPVLAGVLADRIGFGLALRMAFCAQAAAVGLTVLPGGSIGLIASSLVMGAFVPGIVPLVLGRIQELAADAETREAAWSTATTAFALGQAAAAYAFSFLFEMSGNHVVLFELGAGALVLAVIIDVIAVRRGPQSHAGAICDRDKGHHLKLFPRQPEVP